MKGSLDRQAVFLGLTKQGRETPNRIGRPKALCPLLSVLFLINASAHAYCAEPSAPSCLVMSEANDWCERSVKSYLADVREYIGCVFQEAKETAEEARQEAEQAADEAASEAETAADAARDEADRVIKKWNCLASGEKYCY